MLEASCAEDALRIAHNKKPALAVVDIHLPNGANGYELCRKLREMRPRRVAVFLVTGVYKDPEYRLKAFEAGAVGFWEKPVPLTRIRGDIQLLLDTPKPLLQLGRREAAGGVVAVKAPATLAEVLVVDDDEDMIKAMGLHLEDGGFTPYAACSGFQAVALACALQPAAIVLDIKLPDVDGTEVLRILKAHPDTGHIPILIWTGSPQHGRELTCLSSGAADYLVKTVHDVSALPLRVKRALHAAETTAGSFVAEGRIRIDLKQRVVNVDGTVVADLTPMEYELLLCLVRRSPAVVPWADLERHVRKAQAGSRGLSYASDTLEVHCHNLRGKLGSASACIVTHRGVGLQFNPDLLP